MRVEIAMVVTYVPLIVVRREGVLGLVCSVGAEEKEWWQCFRHDV